MLYIVKFDELHLQWTLRSKYSTVLKLFFSWLYQTLKQFDLNVYLFQM